MGRLRALHVKHVCFDFPVAGRIQPKTCLGSYCPDNPVKAQHTRPSLQSHINLGSYLFVYSDI